MESTDKALPLDNDCVDSAEDFRQYVLNLWLSNKDSAKFMQKLNSKASKAGAAGVQTISRIGAGGAHLQNAARDLRRLSLRGCQMPPPYWFDVPIWGNEIAATKMVSIPILLPHELIWALLNSGAIVLAQICVDAYTGHLRELAASVCSKLQVDSSTHIGLGLHGDGVPMQKKTDKRLRSTALIFQCVFGVKGFYGFARETILLQMWEMFWAPYT